MIAEGHVHLARAHMSKARRKLLATPDIWHLLAKQADTQINQASVELEQGTVSSWGRGMMMLAEAMLTLDAMPRYLFTEIKAPTCFDIIEAMRELQSAIRIVEWQPPVAWLRDNSGRVPRKQKGD